ncbi:MAG: hypothetical protein ABSF09_10140 [Candidatus Bathyarchaeia archaeon]
MSTLSNALEENMRDRTKNSGKRQFSLTDGPACNKWMPCEAITETQLGVNLVTIRHYACDECGQSWEKRGEELRQISNRRHEV